MGAASFHVVYGICWDIDAGDEELVSLLEQRHEPRQLAARHHQLDSLWGLTTDDNRHFLLIGKVVGHFGWENAPSAQLTNAELVAVAEQTKHELLAAGFPDEPAWPFQFEPDY
jgi:hypothetical protein